MIRSTTYQIEGRAESAGHAGGPAPPRTHCRRCCLGPPHVILFRVIFVLVPIAVIAAFRLCRAAFTLTGAVEDARSTEGEPCRLLIDWGAVRIILP